MTTSELLRQAAAEVRRGWCQRKMSRGLNVCSLGALERAAGTDMEMAVYVPALRLACALGLASDDDIGFISAILDWNDAPGQTQENVAAGFELAAVLEEERERAAAAEAPATEALSVVAADVKLKQAGER